MKLVLVRCIQAHQETPMNRDLFFQRKQRLVATQIYYTLKE